MNFLKVSCFVIVFAFASCNPLNIKNEQGFSDVLSIVVNKDGVKYIKNSYSTFTAQALDTIPEESCGVASYIVDYENQPANTPPYEANLISWKKLGSPFKYISGSIHDSYNDTVLSISSVLNLEHFMFLYVDQKVPEDYVYGYELLCCKDSVENERMVMYLKTKLYSEGIDSISRNRSSIIAFDILPFLEDQIKQGNDSLIQFNLKYSYKTDLIGNLIYSAYKSNPIKINP